MAELNGLKISELIKSKNINNENIKNDIIKYSIQNNQENYYIGEMIYGKYSINYTIEELTILLNTNIKFYIILEYTTGLTKENGKIMRNITASKYLCYENIINSSTNYEELILEGSKIFKLINENERKIAIEIIL